MSPPRSRKPSHIDAEGKARMVDVSNKKVTERRARAQAFVRLSPDALTTIGDEALEKGDALTVAKIAGVMAAKKTHELIPLCHPLSLAHIDVSAEVVEGGVLIGSEVKTTERTGVEMEALTAASVAALTIYDMCKSIDKGITIESVMLVQKTGGKSGDWNRSA